MTVQVPHTSYLKKLLPHLGWGGVRLVHLPLSYENIRQVSDVYDQVYTPPLPRKACIVHTVAPLLMIGITMLGAARDFLADAHGGQSRGLGLQRLWQHEFFYICEHPAQRRLVAYIHSILWDGFGIEDKVC